MKGLKIKRIAKGLTRKALAMEVNLSHKSIYKYESGERRPSLDTLKKFTEIFNCTIEELL